MADGCHTLRIATAHAPMHTLNAVDIPTSPVEADAVIFFGKFALFQFSHFQSFKLVDVQFFASFESSKFCTSILRSTLAYSCSDCTMGPSVCALWFVCALLSMATPAVATEPISCNPCAETSGCCGLQCCSDAVHDQVSVDDKERSDVGATARPTATMATREQLPPPSVTPVANWTTVFRVGEKGFGCMRFPELHFANNTLYMFVECCE
jgi:hypothetical protein